MVGRTWFLRTLQAKHCTTTVLTGNYLLWQSSSIPEGAGKGENIVRIHRKDMGDGLRDYGKLYKLQYKLLIVQTANLNHHQRPARTVGSRTVKFEGHTTSMM